ncbi:hypothetical protein CCH79_00014507 [Gambusia affinis]|uniref:Uncharacterized protein n=1 Tax=Gambusia affinis TaxID=33528 RepID=A0A315USL8_GAMAF|nr:hypothetical protein CCH79_00014507 [Gambusia affinis]
MGEKGEAVKQHKYFSVHLDNRLDRRVNSEAVRLDTLRKLGSFKNVDPDDLNYASLSFQAKAKKSHRSGPQREPEPHVVQEVLFSEASTSELNIDEMQLALDPSTSLYQNMCEAEGKHL